MPQSQIMQQGSDIKQPIIKTRTANEKFWFVANVRPNTEAESNKRLVEEGYETFLPAQEYVSQWADGRRKVRQRIVTPGKILIHCTGKERLDIVKLPYIKSFMVNMARGINEYGRHPIATIPDEQVKKFMFILGNSNIDVQLDNVNLRVGTKIRVMRGALMGLEGLVTELSSNNTRVYVNLYIRGCASMSIPTEDIERI